MRRLSCSITPPHLIGDSGGGFVNRSICDSWEVHLAREGDRWAGALRSGRIFSASRVCGDLTPDRRGVRASIYDPGHDLETVAAQDLRELAQLQAVIALRITVDEDGLAQDFEPRFRSVVEDVVRRVFPEERVDALREPSHFVFRNGSPVPRQSLSLAQPQRVQDDGRRDRAAENPVVLADEMIGCHSETDVLRGALAGKGDDIVRDGDFSTIGVGE